MRRRLHASACCLGWLLCGAATLAEAQQGAAAADAAIVPATGEDEMAILEVRINGTPQDAPRPLLRHAGRLYATAADLNGWNLVIPGTPALRREGVDWYDLQLLAGARLRIDDATQALDLQLAPEAFETSVGAARGIERPPVSPSVFGAFLNYDVVVQRDDNGTRVAGLFDGTASGDWGQVGSNFISSPAGLGTSGLVRLDTQFSRDDPDRLRRLTVGDAITQAAPWSTPVRYGGIQWGTRYGLQPGYVTYPLPTLRGGAAVPSSVEVYVDNVLRYQQPVAAGPFAINNVPVLSGAGEMRFAVTDALGVRRIVDTPYYVSSNLLRAGLSDYSLEAGWTRKRYAERSFDYGDAFASGSWRYGLSDAATVDTHAEASAASRTAGVGLTWVWGSLGEFAVHGAASQGRQAVAAGSAAAAEGTGRLVRAAYSRYSSDWNFSVMRQVASAGFTQVGWQDDFSHLRTQTQLFAGRSLGRYGTLGATYTQLGYSTGEQVRVTSANWSLGIGDRASLSTFVARTQQSAGPSSTTLGVTFTMTLGRNLNSAVSVQRTGTASRSAQAEVTRQPVDDQGLGYRLRAADGDVGRAEAGVDWRTRQAVLSADVARLSNQSAGRLRAVGSAGYAGGMLFATRASNEAYALVTVEGSPGVTIYRENQPWTTTDASGRAIVPGLRAYGANDISIEAGDLPIEATLRRDGVRVVPRYRTVADVRFDLSYDLVVNATVRLPDGTPVPAGAEVVGSGRSEPLLVGFDGAISVPGPKTGEVFEARWRNERCRFALGEIDPRAKLPSLGPLACTMIGGSSPSPQPNLPGSPQ